MKTPKLPKPNVDAKLYNVGDKVKVKSLSWFKRIRKKQKDVRNATFYDGIQLPSGTRFTNEMKKYCGEEAIITEILLEDDRYRINLDDHDNYGKWYWTDEMFSPIKK
jgi:hypothetical protein